jgi:photosystem II stability/assembly factor-like uncharacterized protein
MGEETRVNFQSATEWQQFPPVSIPTPVLALAEGDNGLWVGGLGGVAWRPTNRAWETRLSDLPLTRVAALSYAGGWLLAGGAEGIARSSDGGLTWRLGKTDSRAQVTAIVASPRFATDGTALAATIGDGILRTSDAGRTWDWANFGLEDFEVMALAWAKGDTILAGTASGLYRSPNGGRAWRLIDGGLPVAALAFLPNGGVVAALEEERLLRSEDGGIRWTAHSRLPEGVLATALLATPAGMLLLGTATHGLLRSTDEGESWSQADQHATLTFLNGSAELGELYAGTDGGLLASIDDGVTWQPETVPPIHDLRRLFIVGGRPLLAGPHTGMVRYHPEMGWSMLPEAPAPLTAASLGPGGSLFRAGPTGLARSTDAGESWQILVPGEAGQVEQFTFGAAGLGWAGRSQGGHLLQTQDGGATWTPRESPFGMLHLLALQVTPEMIIAITYDLQQQVVQPWRSFDGGQSWARGAKVQTPWPLTATYDTPALFTIGNILYLQQSGDHWLEIRIGSEESAVRRIVGNSEVLLALTTNGLYHSLDQGQSWTESDDELPAAQVMDIALAENIVYVLLAGGQVWSKTLASILTPQAKEETEDL